jgi:hypothetical protein
MKPRQATPRWVLLTALLLVTLWLPLSSHDWLEAAGWIHQHVGHDDGDPDHAAADGHVRIEQTGLTVSAPHVIRHPWHSFVAKLERVAPPLVLIPGEPPVLFGHAPPDLARAWQFVLRQALPGRAPSPAS